MNVASLFVFIIRTVKSSKSIWYDIPRFGYISEKTLCDTHTATPIYNCMDEPRPQCNRNKCVSNSRFVPHEHNTTMRSDKQSIQSCVSVRIRQSSCWWCGNRAYTGNVHRRHTLYSVIHAGFHMWVCAIVYCISGIRVLVFLSWDIHHCKTLVETSRRLLSVRVESVFYFLIIKCIKHFVFRPSNTIRAVNKSHFINTLIVGWAIGGPQNTKHLLNINFNTMFFLRVSRFVACCVSYTNLRQC